MTRNELIYKIYEKLFDKNKLQLASFRCKEEWFNKFNEKDLLNHIIIYTNFLPKESKINERVYCILNNINELRKCLNCNSRIKFVKPSKGYLTYCSIKCAKNHKLIKEKTRKTNIEKYGEACTLNNKEIKRKSIETIKKNHGVDHIFKSKSVKNKIKDKLRKKYGIINQGQRNLSSEIIDKINNKNWIYQQHIELKKNPYQIAKEIGVTPRTIYSKLKLFNIELNKNLYQSQYELEIIDFIKYIVDIDIKQNYRKIIYPYELDIYLKEYNLAIEFNGLYWHSFNKNEKPKEKNKHLIKTELCKNKNIQLLHIFENEWLNKNKKDIWKSIICNKLDKSYKIYARKCIIKELDNKTTIEFLDQNHLQGHCYSSIKLGLYYNNDLVFIMVLDQIKNNLYELIRFCNKKFISVIGGASKLFNYFVKNYYPELIVGLCDLRYSNGNIYNNINFKYMYQSKPICYYYHPSESNILINNSCRNMFEKGYRRIWDCGNLIFLWKK